MSKISIIIPAYNAAPTIQHCLKSIFNQTFQDFEIIVVNDGSTDNTGNILKNYAGRIKIISQANQGAAQARNRGEREAAAPFVIFCDADITMKPKMLGTMYQALQNNPEKSYAYSAFKFGWKKFRLWPFEAAKLKQMPFIHTTSLIRREHFPGFDPGLKRFQDWDLYLTMLEQNHTGVFIPEILFTVKPGGTMSSWLPKFIYKINFSRRIKKLDDYKTAEAIIKNKHHL